jgi:hypothetical protein
VSGLLRLFPNPTFRSVGIPLGLDHPEQARLGVYDLQGRELVRIFSGSLIPGQRDFIWDGSDAAARPVAAGVYRVRYEGTRSGVRVGRVVVLR